MRRARVGTISVIAGDPEHLYGESARGKTHGHTRTRRAGDGTLVRVTPSLAPLRRRPGMAQKRPATRLPRGLDPTPFLQAGALMQHADAGATNPQPLWFPWNASGGGKATAPANAPGRGLNRWSGDLDRRPVWAPGMAQEASHVPLPE